MALRYIIAFVAALGASPALAQETPCFELDEATTFCGREAGWAKTPAQPVPGTTSFVNRAYLFAVTVQRNHGQTPSPALYDAAISSALQGMDTRTDLPDGTHRAKDMSFIRRDGMEGRRMLIQSTFDGVPASFMMDVYYSDEHAWILQTGHAGAIDPERLARVHALTLQEMQFDP